jgi:hypothetical protein
MMMAPFAYISCALASAIAAFLLLRSYSANRTQLLLWSGLCFVLLAAENAMIFVDLVMLPTTIDLRLVRLSLGLGGFACLLFGLIWESPGS